MIVDAILSLRPNSKWYLEGNELKGLVWLDDIKTRPSDEEIKNEAFRLEQIKKQTEYIDQRKNEYPSIGDQLDALFKAGVFPEEMAAKIQAVKDKYPKQG